MRKILLPMLWLPLLLAAAPATQPAAVTTESLLNDGPYKPAALDMVLHDDKRNKDLPIKVRFPQDAGGSMPVVIFSHGLGGSDDAFGELTAHWASRGYVVILPTHSDSIALRRKNGQDAPSLRSPDRSALKYLNIPDRLADIHLILDSLDDVQKKIATENTAKTAVTLDHDHVAMAGHSAGAMTTGLSIGVKATPPGGKEMMVADPRIKAGILVSGQGTSTKMFNKDSWNAIDLPMFVITGSKDTETITNETPESRQEPYKFAKPGDKYLLFIEGATHGSYGGRTMANALREKPETDPKMITDAVKAGTTAFLDAYIKGDADAKAYLLTDALPKSSGNKATLDHK